MHVWSWHLGRVGEYGKWEERPPHPVTGVPADYFYELNDGTRLPRWRDPFVKGGATPDKCWYRAEEIAKLTGKSLHWVRRVCREGRLQATKPLGAKEWFIRGDRLLAFIEGQGDVAPLPEFVPGPEANGRSAAE